MRHYTNNAYYTSKKEIGKDAALASVKDLIKLVDICRTDKLIMQNAFSLDFSDYEDAVQCASAIAEGLDGIVTRNTKDFAGSPIPVYSPAEFIKVLNNELSPNINE